MSEKDENITLTKEDLREALREMGAYVDVTEEDLEKIYEIAARIARDRCAHSWLAREVMTADVVSVKPDADVYEAGRLLIRNRISGMPVVDDGNHVVGMLSTADLLSMAGIPRGHVFSDIVMKYVLHKPSPRHRTARAVKDVMTTPAVSVTSGTTVRKIAELLDRKGIKRVPVVDDEGRLVGIVSRADIIRIICEESAEASAGKGNPA